MQFSLDGCFDNMRSDNVDPSSNLLISNGPRTNKINETSTSKRNKESPINFNQNSPLIDEIELDGNDSGSEDEIDLLPIITTNYNHSSNGSRRRWFKQLSFSCCFCWLRKIFGY